MPFENVTLNSPIARNAGMSLLLQMAVPVNVDEFVEIQLEDH